MTNSSSRKFLLMAAVAIAAIMLPAATAQAQYYGNAYAQQPPPLYPYVVQNNQPYAVQVAPGTYVIQRPAAERPRPNRGNSSARKSAIKKTAPASDRPRKPVDHALVDELRQRAKSKNSQSKDNTINTTKIVRGKPIVVETTRVVDDPPRIVERYNVVDGAPSRPPRGDVAKRPGRDDGKKRVIRAEAEITIIGPDRMSIRLFRKGDASNASAD